MNKRPISNEVQFASTVIVLFFVGLLLASLFGVWLKLFWFGWVMLP